MSDSRQRVVLRPMRVGDIPQVMEVDQLSFPTPWPLNTYHYEITQNRNSWMFVVSQPSLISENGRGLGNLIKRLLAPQRSEQVMGYSGCWHVVDETHISTIAVHPSWRRHRIGELLVWSMIRQGIRNGANMVTLEVRVSNIVAQTLYRKYGFEIVGVRKGYYRDNQEDAYMMTAKPLDEAYRLRLLEQGRELKRHLSVLDEW